MKTIVLVILILIVLWGIQWMFHGFPTKSTDNNTSEDIEISLNEFLRDPGLSPIIENCIPRYNDEFKKLNTQFENLPDILTVDSFSKNQLIIIDHNTGKKEVNLSTINTINEFFNVLNSPMSDSKLLQECFGKYGYTINDMERVKNRFSNFANAK